LLIQKLAAPIFEITDRRLSQGTVAAAGPIEVPLVEIISVKDGGAILLPNVRLLAIDLGQRQKQEERLGFTIDRWRTTNIAHTALSFRRRLM
jgi:hypothetical protein